MVTNKQTERILQSFELAGTVKLLKEILSHINIDLVIKEAAEIVIPHDVIGTFYNDFLAKCLENASKFN